MCKVSKLRLFFLLVLPLIALIHPVNTLATEIDNVVSLPSVKSYVRESEQATFELKELQSISVLSKTIDENLKFKLQKFTYELSKNLSITPPTIQYGESLTPSSEKGILIKYNFDMPLNEYKITIQKNIVIESGNDQAIAYALTTLKQFSVNQSSLTYGTISDSPDASERSFNLDSGRKYYSKEFMFQLIDQLAEYKFNYLQLHFSENEGFRIESESHPEIVSDEAWTKEEVQEIISYARKNYIEIIPELDSPGHLRQALKTHPEFQLKDRSGKALENSLDITNPEAVIFIKEIINEFTEVFKESNYFHIGGDEFVDMDRIENYPDIVAASKEKYGTEADGTEAFIDYINEIAQFVKEKGFVPRIWNDGVYRAGRAPLTQVDKDIQITYWTKWQANMAPIQRFIDEGHTVLNFNDAYFYYVLGEAASYKYPTPDKIYNNWHLGVFPNIRSGVPQTYEKPYPTSIIGASFSVWSDLPNAQSEEEVFQGVYLPIRAMAERAWGAENASSYEEFETETREIVPENGRLGEITEIPVYQSGGDIIVRYQNELGENLADEIVLKGYIGQTYETAKQQIPDYTFLKINGETIGMYTEATQEVTYVYTKNVIKGQPVTVYYHDEEGKEIKEQEVLEGNLGEKFETEKKEIQGYLFKTVEGETTGVFSDKKQEVVYIYTKNPDALSTTNQNKPTSIKNDAKQFPKTSDNSSRVNGVTILGLIIFFIFGGILMKKSNLNNLFF